jgi:hypothetical protein
VKFDGSIDSGLLIKIRNTVCAEVLPQKHVENLNPKQLIVVSLPLEQIGPFFEHHEIFPARTNSGVHYLPLQPLNLQ